MNYTGTARTNYFSVKNEQAFRKWATSRDCEVIEDHTGKFGLIADDGSWPGSIYDEEEDDYIEVDVMVEILDHLPDGEVAIFMEAGSEGERYVVGQAFAVSPGRAALYVGLATIYDKVRLEWGIDPTRASY